MERVTTQQLAMMPIEFKLNGQTVRPSQELIKPELHVRQSTGKPVERA